MRQLPVAGGRVTKEPAVDGIVETCPADVIQGFHNDPFKARITGFREDIERQMQCCRVRKLRVGSEAPELRVERGEHSRRELRVADRRVVAGTPGVRGGSGGASGLHVERLGHLHQHRAHAIERHERAAGENVASRRQKGGGGPTAEAVPFADVRPILRVDADGDEAIVNKGGDCRIGITGAIHLGAPMTPSRRDRQQNRLLLVARSRERGAAPRLPPHAVGWTIRESHQNLVIIMRRCSRCGTLACSLLRCGWAGCSCSARSPPLPYSMCWRCATSLTIDWSPGPSSAKSFDGFIY